MFDRHHIILNDICYKYKSFLLYDIEIEIPDLIMNCSIFDKFKFTQLTKHIFSLFTNC